MITKWALSPFYREKQDLGCEKSCLVPPGDLAVRMNKKKKHEYKCVDYDSKGSFHFITSDIVHVDTVDGYILQIHILYLQLGECCM